MVVVYGGRSSVGRASVCGSECRQFDSGRPPIFCVMETSSYIAISRNSALNNKIDVITNNVSNSNSDGYTRDIVIFNEYMHNSGSSGASFPANISTFRDISSGAARETGGVLHLLIGVNDAYFAVRTPRGIRYTRNGAFSISSDGVLLKAGYPVLNVDEGEISFDKPPRNLLFSEKGEVISDGVKISDIGVFAFSNSMYSLIKEGADLLKLDTEDAPFIVESPNIKQGYLESSNAVNLLELTDLNSSVNDNKIIVNVYNDIEKMLGDLVQELVGRKAGRSE